jgi:GNAT superfamily N-acetyltransferase
VNIVTIRAARPDDVPALRDIERAAGELFTEIGMREVADDELPSEDVLLGFQRAGMAWVATDDTDRPIGYLLAEILDGNAHIEQLSVLPANMRRGLGRALIEHVATWAADRGLPAITLTTFADVSWNAPYYRRLGFEPLADEEITPQLRARRDEESRHFLNRWARVCMRRDSGSPPLKPRPTSPAPSSQRQ